MPYSSQKASRFSFLMSAAATNSQSGEATYPLAWTCAVPDPVAPLVLPGRPQPMIPILSFFTFSPYSQLWFCLHNHIQNATSGYPCIASASHATIPPTNTIAAQTRISNQTRLVTKPGTAPTA